ncbi:hypothetical protein AB0M42_06865 [Streptomyces sp. NPDC051784]|uniref:hypothetical protein n=1 Tax=Streptomyces sp. NPDC051784 TaxID=3155805 RepID=UPI0034394C77
MSGGRACLAARLGERLEILGLKVVLLGYWGTVSLLARRGGRPRTGSGESVRLPR